MRDWLTEVDTEPPPDKPFKRYVVRPHYSWYTAPETGRRLYRRFSCVGFVLECYSSTGIDLVTTDEANLPDVDFNTLVEAYPEIEREEALERLGVTRNDLGIDGDGPWPILLVGYVFHALDNATDEDARPETHTPETVEEAYFPRPVS